MRRRDFVLTGSAALAASADLPIEHATARALGIEIPPAVLAFADRVIE